MILQRRPIALILGLAIGGLAAAPASATPPAPAGPDGIPGLQPVEGTLNAVPSLVGGALGHVGDLLGGGAHGGPGAAPQPAPPPPPPSTVPEPPPVPRESDPAGLEPPATSGEARGPATNSEPATPGGRSEPAAGGAAPEGDPERTASSALASTPAADSGPAGEAAAGPSGGVAGEGSLGVADLSAAAMPREDRGTLERIVAVVPWPLDLALAALVLALVWLTARNFGFRKRLAEAERLAMTDGLTGLPNRQDAERWLQRLAAGAERTGRPVSIALIDLDHFKAINDDFGHQAGDATLRGVARALRSELRAADHVGRLGGEEFVAILPDTDPETAIVVAERIRERIAAMPRRVDRAVTASIGVASFPGDATDLGEFMGAADRALYAAKEAGRDRVVWAGALEAREDAAQAPVPA